jgi:hypothetical protein
VFSHPSESGGFRLRYGRARNHGFATAGVHPATMHLVDDFLATGTQIKGVVPVDSIEGPTVRLANGDVRRIDDPQEALAVRNGVEEILDLGEYLVNYGEFVENNHPLAPAAYAVEWWVQEFGDAGADVRALRDDPTVSLDDPTPEEALAWADDYDAPLHPAYTYLWHDITVDEFEQLAAAVADGEVTGDVLVVEGVEPVAVPAVAPPTGDRRRAPPELGPASGVGTDVRRRGQRDPSGQRRRTVPGPGACPHPGWQPDGPPGKIRVPGAVAGGPHPLPNRGGWREPTLCRGGGPHPHGRGSGGDRGPGRGTRVSRLRGAHVRTPV